MSDHTSDHTSDDYTSDHVSEHKPDHVSDHMLKHNSDSITASDRALLHELEACVGQRFYEACDRITKTLLSRCEWYITTNANALTLVIRCPDIPTNWHILSNITAIGEPLEKLHRGAKVRVCPPIAHGTPFELRVDEIPIYRDLI